MGRHAGSAPPVDPRSRVTVWLERLLVGILAGGVIAVVLRWAGTAPSTSVTVGLGVLLLVPVAAWVASTVPSPPPDDGSDDRSSQPSDEPHDGRRG